MGKLTPRADEITIPMLKAIGDDQGPNAQKAGKYEVR